MTRALLAVLLAAAPVAAEEDVWDARLTKASGSVTVVLGDEGGAQVPGEEGMPLSSGDRLRTGPDGEAELALDPDNLIELGPGSDLEVGSLEPSASSFSLWAGLLLARLRAAAGLGWSVRTPDAVAAVRGTEFAVELDAEGTTVGVFDEGKVALSASDPDGFGETLLEAGREATARRGAKGPLNVQRLTRIERHRIRVGRMRGRPALLRRGWRRIGGQQRRQQRRERLERRPQRQRPQREPQRRQRRPRPGPRQNPPR